MKRMKIYKMILLFFKTKCPNFVKRSNDKKWNAQNVFQLFITFDNLLFGHTRFLIKDNELFKGEDVLNNNKKDSLD